MTAGAGFWLPGSGAKTIRHGGTQYRIAKFCPVSERIAVCGVRLPRGQMESAAHCLRDSISSLIVCWRVPNPWLPCRSTMAAPSLWRTLRGWCDSSNCLLPVAGSAQGGRAARDTRLFSAWPLAGQQDHRQSAASVVLRGLAGRGDWLERCGDPDPIGFHEFLTERLGKHKNSLKTALRRW